MVERIEDMPQGTVGFRATGHVTREDYREVMTRDLDGLDEAKAWVAEGYPPTHGQPTSSL